MDLAIRRKAGYTCSYEVHEEQYVMRIGTITMQYSDVFAAGISTGRYTLLHSRGCPVLPGTVLRNPKDLCIHNTLSKYTLIIKLL